MEIRLFLWQLFVIVFWIAIGYLIYKYFKSKKATK